MWKNIQINANLIKHETGKAVLIALPHSSDFDGFAFWHPSKLVRPSKFRKDAVSIGYTDDFVFKIKRTSNRTFKVLDERELTSKEIEEIFGKVDHEITKYDFPKKKIEEEIINVPEKMNPIENPIADEELIDE